LQIPNHTLSTLRALDWSDLSEVQHRSRIFLNELASNSILLADLTQNARSDETLFPLCEHLDVLDKIVLYDDPAGFRLRLHVFGPGYFDRPHNHRWIYTNLVLRGRYLHEIYLISEPRSDEEAPTFAPLISRVENEGDSYTLNTNVAHSIKAEPYTTTLILRGPATKDRFVVTDRVTGRTWWQYGAAQESKAEQEKKRMSLENFSELENRLRQMSIIAM
jgi:hypothetical protein